MSVISPVVPVSDLRYQTKGILTQVKDEPVVLTQRGRATAVIVDFETYNRMARRLQVLEEIRDEAMALIAQAHLEQMEFVGLDALLDLYAEKLGEPLPVPTAA